MKQNKMVPSFRRRVRMGVLTGVSALVLTGCTVTPEKITLEEQRKLAITDRMEMFAGQEPVVAPIGLDEAMARAVKYNLQQRLGLMEQALADDLLDIRSLDMLPKAAAQAGWKTRNNEQASSSESIESGSQSLEPSTSQDRTSRNSSLQLSWNVLDFGVSYFGAKVHGNKVLAAEERRRRVIADIIQKVRVAYWEAESAQRLQPQVKEALLEAQRALANAKKAGQERLEAPVESLRYQKNLLEMIRQLEALEDELASAKVRLASLMNLPPATDYTLEVQPDTELTPPDLAYTREQLEDLAMTSRPEIREEAYAARNAVLEARMSLLKLLPGANLFGGIQYDSNSFLVNKHWADAGMQVSWNLFNLLNYSKYEKAGEDKKKLADLRRQALRMAVLTQVDLAWYRFKQASRVFERSRELQNLQRNILTQTESAYSSNAQSLLERVRIRTETVLATRMRDRSFAEMRGAHGAIYQAVGLDPLPQRVEGHSIMQLSKAIAGNRHLLAQGVPVAQPLQVQTAQATPKVVALAPAPATPEPVVKKKLHLDMWKNFESLQGAELVSWDE
ncbi:TolC family protein [Terasakiella pusilla]|uniref:TolC family protein n=1 Tax=Terasakiella pusilla TaxID=64973 RepID=UPI003AA84BBF